MSEHTNLRNSGGNHTKDTEDGSLSKTRPSRIRKPRKFDDYYVFGNNEPSCAITQLQKPRKSKEVTSHEEHNASISDISLNVSLQTSSAAATGYSILNSCSVNDGENLSNLTVEAPKKKRGRPRKKTSDLKDEPSMSPAATILCNHRNTNKTKKRDEINGKDDIDIIESSATDGMKSQESHNQRKVTRSKSSTLKSCSEDTSSSSLKPNPHDTKKGIKRPRISSDGDSNSFSDVQNHSVVKRRHVRPEIYFNEDFKSFSHNPDLLSVMTERGESENSPIEDSISSSHKSDASDVKRGHQRPKTSTAVTKDNQVDDFVESIDGKESSFKDDCEINSCDSLRARNDLKSQNSSNSSSGLTVKRRKSRTITKDKETISSLNCVTKLTENIQDSLENENIERVNVKGNNCVDTNNSTDSPVKRRRGRSRKNGVEEGNISKNGNSEVKNKKGTSFLSKSSCSADVSFHDKDNQTATSSWSGELEFTENNQDSSERKKIEEANVEVSKVVDPDTSSDSAVKRRGGSRLHWKTAENRRKNEICEESNNRTLLFTDSGDIRCIHCDLHFKSTSSYKFHLMAKHSLVRIPGYPNGVNDAYLLVKKQGYADCQKCSKRFRNAQYYKHHLIWCGRENEMFYCNICKRHTVAMWEVQHMRAHYKQARDTAARQLTVSKETEEGDSAEVTEVEVGVKRKRKAAQSALFMLKESDQMTSTKDDEYVVKEEEEEEEEEEDEESSDDKLKKKKVGEVAENNAYKCIRCCNRGARIHSSEKLDRLYDFYYGSNQCHLFPELFPVVEEWKVLNSSEREKYLSCQKQSPAFSSSTDKKESKETFTLEMGEAKSVEEKIFCYTGGPIWALEWCPPMISVQDRVLAVASDSTLGPQLSVNTLYEGSNLLQFWSTERLENESNDVLPRLVFCIAHDSGYVRSLAWCPSGSYEKVNSNEESNNEKPPKRPLSRLGILAAACSDSSVLIFSIPHPSSIERIFQSTPINEKPIIVKPKPCLRLIPNSKDGASPCLSVSWQKGDGCQNIIGGYGRGEILMWTIEPCSKLIKENDNNVRPVRVFMRHKTPVIICSWCPSLPHLFVSSDFKGLLYVWNVNRPYEPEGVMKRMGIYIPKAICWAGPLSWGVFSANDRFSILDKSSINSHVVYFHGLSDHCLQNDFSLPISKHFVCTWDVTYDPLFCVLVCCDAVGNVMVSHLRDDKILVMSESKKSTSSLVTSLGHALLYKVSTARFENKSVEDHTSLSTSNNSQITDEIKNSLEKEKTYDLKESVVAENDCDESVIHHDNERSSTANIKVMNENNAENSVNHEDNVDQVLHFQECKMVSSQLKKPVSKRFKLKLDSKEREEYKYHQSYMESVHQVRLCPGLDCSLWLASGGNSGLLRMDNLSKLVLPHSRHIHGPLETFWKKIGKDS